MQTRDIQLTAGVEKTIQLGEYDAFRVVECSGVLSIQFGDEGNGTCEGIVRKSRFMFHSAIKRGTIRIKSTVTETVRVFYGLGDTWAGDAQLDNVTLVYNDTPAGDYNLDFTAYGAFCGLLIRNSRTGGSGFALYGLNGTTLSPQMCGRVLENSSVMPLSAAGRGYETGLSSPLSAALLTYYETYGFQVFRVSLSSTQTLYINLVRVPVSWPTATDASGDIVPATVGAGRTVPCSGATAFSLQMTGLDAGGAVALPTSWKAFIEVSLDANAWTRVLEHSSDAGIGNGDTVFTPAGQVYPVKFWRYNVTEVTLGPATAVLLNAYAKH